MGRGAILVDTSIVVDHLTLAARAEGLGTCWIGSFNGPAMKQFFSLPDDIDVCAVTPLGYPAEEGAFGEAAAADAGGGAGDVERLACLTKAHRPTSSSTARAQRGSAPR